MAKNKKDKKSTALDELLSDFQMNYEDLYEKERLLREMSPELQWRFIKNKLWAIVCQTNAKKTGGWEKGVN